MNLTLRIRLPLFSDAFTCKCIGKRFSTTSKVFTGENENYEVNPDFVNRNPRNLEEMGLARKRKGWRFQSPKKEYYNKLVFEKTNRNTSGSILHWSGVTVVSASTNESAILKHFSSRVDITAAENIGSILAHRCLQAGITEVFFDDKEISFTDTVKAFLKGFKGGRVKIGELNPKPAPYKPGIDYEGPNRLGGEDKDQPMKEDYQF